MAHILQVYNLKNNNFRLLFNTKSNANTTIDMEVDLHYHMKI